MRNFIQYKEAKNSIFKQLQTGENGVYHDEMRIANYCVFSTINLSSLITIITEYEHKINGDF